MSENGQNSVAAIEQPQSGGASASNSNVVRQPATGVGSLLTEYAGEKKVRTASLMKGMRSAGGELEEAEYVSALELMRKNDSEGERLWALMSQARLPKPLRTWVWSAAKAQLSRVFGSEVDFAKQAPEELVELTRKRFPTLVSAKDKSEKRIRTYSLRIVVSALLNFYRLDPWDVIGLYGALVCKNENSAKEVIASGIRAGSSKEFSIAASVGILGRRRLVERESELERVRGEKDDLLHRLERSATENTELSTEVERLRSQTVDMSERLIRLEERIEMERQHAGYDYSSLKASHAIVLRERLRPLIQDAIDALEIQTPATGIAVRRLKKALLAIEESI